MTAAAEDDASKYEVRLTRQALANYLAIESESTLKAVDKTLDLLAYFPLMGRIYDPLYEAVRPPFDLHVAYTSHYGIYYEVDDEARAVTIDFIEDNRRDPQTRFGESNR